MNTTNETVLMLIALSYFLGLRALYSALRNLKVARGIVLNLFMGFNVSSIIVLVYKGLHVALNGCKPSWFVALIAVVVCTLILRGRVKIAGIPFFDSLIIGLIIVSTAAVVPVGLCALFQDGLKMSLMWPWAVATLALTLYSMATRNKKRRKRKIQMTLIYDRIIKNDKTDKEV
jgi:hypothetical protein